MRLWSLHPSFLDSKGLVALWREGLLAQHVLFGRTKGYRNHPQLDRFRGHGDAEIVIVAYLHAVWEEATRRGYNFDKTRIFSEAQPTLMQVTEGQMGFELQHLHNKLAVRDPAHLAAIGNHPLIPHPIFEIIPGAIAGWERP